MSKAKIYPELYQISDDPLAFGEYGCMRATLHLHEDHNCYILPATPLTKEEIEKEAKKRYPYDTDDYDYPVQREKRKWEVDRLRAAFIAGAEFILNAGRK